MNTPSTPRTLGFKTISQRANQSRSRALRRRSKAILAEYGEAVLNDECLGLVRFVLSRMDSDLKEWSYRWR